MQKSVPTLLAIEKSAAYWNIWLPSRPRLPRVLKLSIVAGDLVEPRREPSNRNEAATASRPFGHPIVGASEANCHET